jgi:hypothetical protein
MCQLQILHQRRAVFATRQVVLRASLLDYYVLVENLRTHCDLLTTEVPRADFGRNYFYSNQRKGSTYPSLRIF